MDDVESDQREPHITDPPQFVDLETLKSIGVLYYKLDPKNYREDLDKIREDRGYNYEDIVECTPTKLPNYEHTLKGFFDEHLHADEEIRFFVEGSGYFDCRHHDDKWIRMELVAGDLIILPAGIYHRFTLDANNYAMVRRFFVGEPVWTAHPRAKSDSMEVRKQYLKAFS